MPLVDREVGGEPGAEGLQRVPGVARPERRLGRAERARGEQHQAHPAWMGAGLPSFDDQDSQQAKDAERRDPGGQDSGEDPEEERGGEGCRRGGLQRRPARRPGPEDGHHLPEVGLPIEEVLRHQRRQGERREQDEDCQRRIAQQAPQRERRGTQRHDRQELERLGRLQPEPAGEQVRPHPVAVLARVEERERPVPEAPHQEDRDRGVGAVGRSRADAVPEAERAPGQHGRRRHDAPEFPPRLAWLGIDAHARPGTLVRSVVRRNDSRRGSGHPGWRSRGDRARPVQAITVGRRSAPRPRRDSASALDAMRRSGRSDRRPTHRQGTEARVHAPPRARAPRSRRFRRGSPSRAAGFAGFACLRQPDLRGGVAGRPESEPSSAQ